MVRYIIVALFVAGSAWGQTTNVTVQVPNSIATKRTAICSALATSLGVPSLTGQKCANLIFRRGLREIAMDQKRRESRDNERTDRAFIDERWTQTLIGFVCGDGAIDPGEQCDDGNQTPGDGCENDCSPTP